MAISNALSEYIARYLPAHKRRTVGTAARASLGLATDEYAFLETLGVPAGVVLEFRFTLRCVGDDQVLVAESPQDAALVLSRDLSVIFCLATDNSEAPRFVNDSLLQCVACFSAFERYCDAIEQIPPNATRCFREDLSWIDKHALADPENWWSLIAEQVDDGLL